MQIANKNNLSCSTPASIPSASRNMHVSAITNHWCHRSTGWASKRRSLLAWRESRRVFFAREQIGQLVAGNLQWFETITIIHQPYAQQTFGAWSNSARWMWVLNCMRMRRMRTTLMLNESWPEVNCDLPVQTTEPTLSFLFQTKCSRCWAAQSESQLFHKHWWYVDLPLNH